MCRHKKCEEEDVRLSPSQHDQMSTIVSVLYIENISRYGLCKLEKLVLYYY